MLELIISSCFSYSVGMIFSKIISASNNPHHLLFNKLNKGKLNLTCSNLTVVDY